MTDSQRKHAARDRRLLMALLLFLAAAASLLVQAWILMLYIDAAIYGDWTYFAETFSVPPPASGPVEFCFGRCASELPFLAGWIGIASFFLGMVLVMYSWLKPRSNDLR